MNKKLTAPYAVVFAIAIMFTLLYIGRAWGKLEIETEYIHEIEYVNVPEYIYVPKYIYIYVPFTEPAEPETEPEWTAFTVTAYCKENYPHICNNGDATTTATGTTPTVGRTIAVDPKIIPYGSRVEIEGWGVYIAEDCGGGVNGNRIDLLFETHKAALAFGVQTLNVRVLEG